jgi:hypothetical protein
LAISRYVRGALVAAPAAAVLDADGAASASTYLGSVPALPFASVGDGVDAVLPLVAAVAGPASRRQPVTVTRFALAACGVADEGACVVGDDDVDGAGVAGACDAGDCAITTPEAAKTVATKIPDQVCFCISPPSLIGACNRIATPLPAERRDPRAHFPAICSRFFKMDRTVALVVHGRA